MLDGVSLDQLRTFIAAADEGSFSAAGRPLRRAQSVVSQPLANLERQLGVKLFERHGRLPALTDQGRSNLSSLIDRGFVPFDASCLLMNLFARRWKSCMCSSFHLAKEISHDTTSSTHGRGYAERSQLAAA
jgi:hypothetical protein